VGYFFAPIVKLRSLLCGRRILQFFAVVGVDEGLVESVSEGGPAGHCLSGLPLVLAELSLRRIVPHQSVINDIPQKLIFPYPTYH
jgi:hypothetical protein